MKELMFDAKGSPIGYICDKTDKCFFTNPSESLTASVPTASSSPRRKKYRVEREQSYILLKLQLENLVD
jgi:hypothetical protein